VKRVAEAGQRKTKATVFRRQTKAELMKMSLMCCCFVVIVVYFYPMVAFVAELQKYAKTTTTTTTTTAATTMQKNKQGSKYVNRSNELNYLLLLLPCCVKGKVSLIITVQ